MFPLDNGHQTRIIHPTSTRYIYDYCYEFGQLTQNGHKPSEIFCKLKTYFYIISTNLTLLSIPNMLAARLQISVHVSMINTVMLRACPFFSDLLTNGLQTIIFGPNWLNEQNIFLIQKARFVGKYFIGVNSKNLTKNMSINRCDLIFGIFITVSVVILSLKFSILLYDTEFNTGWLSNRYTIHKV